MNDQFENQPQRSTNSATVSQPSRQSRFSRFSRLTRLATKELRETLRDRRTIVTLIMMPLLVYPILSLVFQNFLLSSLSDLGDGEDTKFRIAYTTNLDPDTQEKFLFALLSQMDSLAPNRQSQDDTDDLDSPTDTDVAESLSPTNEKGYIVVDGDFPNVAPIPKHAWFTIDDGDEATLVQAVAQDDADLGVVMTISDELPPRVEKLELVHREDQVSTQAANWLRLNLQRLNETVAEQAIVAAKIGPGLPISRPQSRRIVIQDGSSSGNTLASLIPLALVMMTITGAVYPAIDLTAGERERGTLETLMAAPVPRMSILFAKFIAVVTVAVLTAILNLIGMSIVMWVFQMDAMLPGGGFTIGIAVKIFLLLVLFAAFFAACLLMVTSFARSFKEAQAYLVPIILLSLGPGLLAMSPSVQLSGLTAVTPMMNLLVLARDLIQGQASVGAGTIAVLSTLVYAFVAISIAARMFGADTILYSQQAGIGSLLARPRNASKFVPVVPALLCLVLLLPVNMISIGILGRVAKGLEDRFEIFCLLLAAFTFLSFFVIPSLIGWLRKVDFRSAFGIRKTGPLFFLAAIILGFSLWPIVMLMVEATYQIYGMVAGEAASSARHETLVRLSEQQVVKFRQLSPAVVALCFSLIPAFCEEWFFRGMLLRSLAKDWKPWMAIITTALLFGVFHILSNSAVSLDRFLPTMLIGILLGYIAWKSNSIWPSFVLHALHNATVVFLGYYQEKLSGLDWFPKEAERIPPSWGLIAIVVAAAGIGLIAITKKHD